MMDAETRIERYLEPSPHRDGLDEVRLKDYGVAVWALVGYLQTPGSSIERVAADYDVPVAAVQAAYDYYQRHQELIDARIAANTTDAPVSLV
jgi:uncharacterized protein (DUF433 family)